MPKIHFSSPRLDVEEHRVRDGGRAVTRYVLPQLRAHADLIDPIGFEAFLRDTPAGRDFDVMLEARAKDLALLRLRGQLADRGPVGAEGVVVVPEREGPAPHPPDHAPERRSAAEALALELRQRLRALLQPGGASARRTAGTFVNCTSR